MRLNDISGLLGTAVNVQAMVFGNMGADSGTGVCFTRDPSTGERRCTASSSSTRRARTSSRACARPSRSRGSRRAPACYAEFARNCALLEAHFGDMQARS